jgi:hypothetical protein
MSALLKPHVDFHVVHEQHVRIHTRLLNWARWCNGRPATQTAPMFRMYQSSARVRAERDSPLQVNRLDAAAVQKAVVELPHAHLAALNWCYLRPVNPSKACREIGTTMNGLSQLLHDARQILVNRGV